MQYNYPGFYSELMGQLQDQRSMALDMLERSRHALEEAGVLPALPALPTREGSVYDRGAPSLAQSVASALTPPRLNAPVPEPVRAKQATPPPPAASETHVSEAGAARGRAGGG